MDLMKQLRSEINAINERIPKLSDDNAFIYWFLSAYLLDTDDSELIKNSIVGAAGDVNIDAYYIDIRNKKVFLIQAKYRQEISVNEKRNDLISFLDIENQLYNKASFNNLLTNANTQIKVVLEEVYQKVIKQKYDLAFIFASTGKIAKELKKEMLRRTKYAHVQLFDGRALLGLFNDYLEGAAPPIPYVELPIDGTSFIMNHNPETNIANYIFFVNTNEMKSIFERYGIKLFARNVRGFLGDTAINEKIQWTLKNEPENFIYLNNGVTIICDNAKFFTDNGHNIIRIDNPQIINGQQTTRCIALEPSNNAKVLVRVVSVTKESSEDLQGFSDMVYRIVASTNFQNAIKPSDLRANDKVQIRIEKDFRKHGYHYVRKRMAKSEVKKYFSGNFTYKIDRFNLIRAIASTLYLDFARNEVKNR